jgi:hypothetical protein
LQRDVEPPRAADALASGAARDQLAEPLAVSSLPAAAPDRAEPASRRGERARPRGERGRGAKHAPKSRRPRAESAAAPSGPATRDCDPPTYMDAAGIRHFKKDCL